MLCPTSLGPHGHGPTALPPHLSRLQNSLVALPNAVSVSWNVSWSRSSLSAADVTRRGNRRIAILRFVNGDQQDDVHRVGPGQVLRRIPPSLDPLVVVKRVATLTAVLLAQ